MPIIVVGLLYSAFKLTQEASSFTFSLFSAFVCLWYIHVTFNVFHWIPKYLCTTSHAKNANIAPRARLRVLVTLHGVRMTTLTKKAIFGRNLCETTASCRKLMIEPKWSFLFVHQMARRVANPNNSLMIVNYISLWIYWQTNYHWPISMAKKKNNNDEWSINNTDLECIRINVWPIISIYVSIFDF